MIERWLTAVVALGHGTGPAELWGASLVGAVAYAVRSARRAGLDPRRAYWGAIIALAFGLVGGRLLGLVVYGVGQPLSWREIVVGGQSWYGGLLAGTLAALASFRLCGAPVLRFADAMAPAGALGYALGRLGCFLNGDDYGVLTHGDFAVRYPADTEAFVAQGDRGLIAPLQALSLPVLPIQLLHAALGLALFFLLRRPAAAPGQRLGLFVLGYGVGRFLLEFGRGDFSATVGRLSLHQAISLVLIAVGLYVCGSRVRVSRTRRFVERSVEPFSTEGQMNQLMEIWSDSDAHQAGALLAGSPCGDER